MPGFSSLERQQESLPPMDRLRPTASVSAAEAMAGFLSPLDMGRPCGWYQS